MQALEDLDFEFRKKELELDKMVSQKRFEAENKKLQELKEAQLAEKKQLLDKHLPEDSSLRSVLNELAEEEERELQEFKAEQEIER